jgi:hypothetical protein
MPSSVTPLRIKKIFLTANFRQWTLIPEGAFDDGRHGYGKSMDRGTRGTRGTRGRGR